MLISSSSKQFIQGCYLLTVTVTLTSGLTGVTTLSLPSTAGQTGELLA